MSVFRTAYVYVRNNFAGILAETDEGYSFQYDNDYLQSENASAVSLTLPLQSEPYTSKTLFSFFDGLIPEGWLLKIVTDTGKSTAVTALACFLSPAKTESVMYP